MIDRCVPEPDGRSLAPRPGVVRKVFTAMVDGCGMTPARPGRQLPLWPIDYALSCWADDSPGWSHGRLCDFDANGMTVNDLVALAKVSHLTLTIVEHEFGMSQGAVVRFLAG